MAGEVVVGASGMAAACARPLTAAALTSAIAEPVSVLVETFGTALVAEDRIAKAVRRVFGLTPRQIMDQLDLRRPIYEKTAAYGHFGRNEKSFTWERTDKAEELASAAGLKKAAG